jgi:Uma2 family endonuclease
MAAVFNQPENTEQRVILHGVKWETYERLLEDLTDRSVPHLTFDHGVLEIMSPTAEHEESNRTLALLVEIAAEEMDIDIRCLGSTTFKRMDLLKGFEPDSCFYIQSVETIRGKRRLDLSQDPPPDLVIEIDITRSSLDRFPLFAKIGVPEIWRYDGKQVRFFFLVDEQYAEVKRSIALPPLNDVIVTQWLEESGDLKRTAWLRHIRQWLRSQQPAD